MSLPSHSDQPVSIRHKLSGLWASTLFCYVYADYFTLFLKGRIAQINQGIIGPLGEATPGVLVGVSAMMAIPSLMVAMSLVLPTAIARWCNIVAGLLFTLIQGATMVGGGPPFYLFFGTIEMAMTLSIAVMAWRWPRV
jgi:hypothetical protein